MIKRPDLLCKLNVLYCKLVLRLIIVYKDKERFHDMCSTVLINQHVFQIYLMYMQNLHIY